MSESPRPYWPSWREMGAGQVIGPWAGLEAVELEPVYHDSIPVLRAAFLLGYRVRAVLVGHDTDDKWARLNLVTPDYPEQAASPPVIEVTDGSSAPFKHFSGYNLAVEIEERPFATMPSESTAVPFPADGAPTWTNQDGYLILGLGSLPSPIDTSSDVNDEPPPVTNPVVKDFIDTAAALLNATVEAGALDDGTEDSSLLAPAGKAGLLWLFNPKWWLAEGDDRRDGPHWGTIERIGFKAYYGFMTFARADPAGSDRGHAHIYDLIMGVLDKTVYAEPVFFGVGVGKIPSLAAVVAVSNYSFPRVRRTNFFRTVQRWLIYRQELDRFPWEVQDDVPHISWLDALVTLIHYGVLDPPYFSTPGTEFEEKPPVEAWLEDENRIRLMVLERYNIDLVRERDHSGKPIAESKADEPLEGFFTWEWIDAPEDEKLGPARVVVVAAPGVRVIGPFEGDEPYDDLEWGAPPESPEDLAEGEEELTLSEDPFAFDIYRVQDPALVPPWGTQIPTQVLSAPFVLADQSAYETVMPLPYAYEDADPFEWAPEAETLDLVVPEIPGVLVKPERDGLTFRYPLYQDADGEGNADTNFCRVTCDPRSPDCKISFDAYFGLGEALIGRDDEPEDYPYDLTHLVVWTSGSVTAMASGDDGIELWKDVDFEQMPLPGDEIPASPRGTQHLRTWRGPIQDSPPGASARILTPEPFPADDWVDYLVQILADPKFILDTSIGFIPYVGDAVDVVEFAYAAYTGTDRWGRPVSNGELVLMGLCAALPVVSSPMARSMGRRLLAAAGNAGPGTLMRDLVGSGNKTIKYDEVRDHTVDTTWSAGGASTRDLRKATTWVRRQLHSLVAVAQAGGRPLATGEYLELRDIIKQPPSRGFQIPGIQVAFNKWKRQALKDGRQLPADAFEQMELFVKEVPMGPARLTLQALLRSDNVGPNTFRRKAAVSRTPSTLHEIKIPPGYTSGKLAERVRNGNLRDAILENVNARTGPDATFGRPIIVGAGDPFLQHSKHVKPGATEYAAFAEKLLLKVSGKSSLADLTGADLEKLVGSKRFHEKELAALLVKSYDMALEEAAKFGRTVDEVLDAPGGESFFRDIITAKGYEHSSRHELEMLASRLADPGVHAVRAQIRTAGVGTDVLKEGADLMEYRKVGDGSLVARPAQGKSYANPRLLTSSVEKWGMFRRREIIRQLSSDFDRWLADRFMVPGPRSVDPDTPLDTTWVFEINDVRYQSAMRSLLSDANGADAARAAEARAVLTGEFGQPEGWIDAVKDSPDADLEDELRVLMEARMRMHRIETNAWLKEQDELGYLAGTHLEGKTIQLEIVYSSDRLMALNP